MNAPLSPARLLRYLDDLKILERPLPNHYAFDADVPAREAYATLLAVVLLCEPSIAESQDRLLRMLLASLGLADDEARLLEAAQQADRGFLAECATLFNEEALARSFLTDAAVLLRLAGPLSEAQQVLLCELADFLRVAEDDVARCAEIAAVVLGHAASGAMFENFDDVQEFVVWKDFVGTELTAARLAKGLDGGVWRVSSPLAMTSGWSLTNCTVLFSREGSITTTGIGSGKDGIKVEIDNCRLDAPVMSFKSITNVTLKNDTVVKGRYVETDQMTAITVYETEAAVFNGCTFSTVDARALWISHTPTIVQKCEFRACGNASLVGGAMAVRRNTAKTQTVDNVWQVAELTISNSRFIDCKALLGGAIRTDSLHESIRGGSFAGCTSGAFDDEMEQIGVFADFAGLESIQNATFRATHLRLGNCNYGAWSAVVSRTRLTQSNVYYHSKGSSVTILSGCDLEGGRSIDNALTPADWWNEF